MTPSAKSRESIDHYTEIAVVVDVEHRRVKRSVTQESLDDLGIPGLLVDPGAERVAEDMRSHVLVDACRGGGSMDLVRRSARGPK